MKTSFNGLKVSVSGIYKVYNLTQDELESLKRRFGSKVKEDNAILTVHDNVSKRINLELFVHEMWAPVSFDIYGDLSRILNSSDISEQTIEKLSKQLEEMQIQLQVDYDWGSNFWSIVNYDEFLELLKSLIAE